MQAKPKRELSLFDSTCIIVGIIIGAGIYQMAPDIAKGAGSPIGIFVIWIVGGLISLFGALGYAELATTYRDAEGGDYVYLSKAYGKWAGFLFGWAQLTIVRPGDIAIMAFAFATYAMAIYNPMGEHSAIMIRIYASVATLILTVINIIGVKQGKWAQNLLTTVKALGLLAIVGLIFFVKGKPSEPAEFDWPPWQLALVFVLFVYGGWNEMAYVAAEVKNARKNIVRALVLGTGAVMLLYLLVNAAFLYTLGYKAMASSDAVASDAVSKLFPNYGGQMISALICISALGAINGLIFTGARITYAMGTEHKMFAALGNWNSKRGTPALALTVQGIIALALILIFGSFTETIIYTAAAVYSFYLATNLSIFVLRYKDRQIERPYKIIGYPFTTIIFCSVCAYLIYSSIDYAYHQQQLALIIMIIILVLGIVVYFIDRKLAKQANQ